MFRLEKLYADLITDEGELCIVYVTRTYLIGRCFEQCGVELYGADGSRTIHRARSNTAPRQLREFALTPTLELELESGRFRLQ